MGYRPITDMWILARAKLKSFPDGTKRFYWGAYLGGFVERARALLGCNINDPVLHVCGGMAKHYPYRRGFGPNDKTLDLDPKCEPDFLQDARQPFPFSDGWVENEREEFSKKFITSPVDLSKARGMTPWAGILIDPPYSEVDAEHYAVGADAYPKPNQLVRNAFEVLPPGGRCGIIHYLIPSPPKDSIFVACVGIFPGYNNRLRAYSVFEKPL
jgi:hypothetical protein